MVELGGRWLLFFSGGAWQTSGYAIAYADCQGPAGPCSDPNGTAVFASTGVGSRPGAPSIFTDTSGTVWMAYNAWTAGNIGYPDGSPQSPHGSAVRRRRDADSARPLLDHPTTRTDLPEPAGPGLPMVATDGGIFSFHAPFLGSVGGQRFNAPVVGMAADPAGGYWEVASDGGIFAFGTPFYGSQAAARSAHRSSVWPPHPTAAATGRWIATETSPVSVMPSISGRWGVHRLNKPIVAMAAEPGRRWLLGGGLRRGHLRLRQRPLLRVDGGSAPQQADRVGSPPRRTAAVTGKWPPTGASSPSAMPASTGRWEAPASTSRWSAITSTPDGGGYWEVASDGGIFAFGDARFYGSMGGTRLNKPVVSMASFGG